MPIPVNLPPTPQMDKSLLPYLNQLSQNIVAAFQRAAPSYTGSTTERLGLSSPSVGTMWYDLNLRRLYIWNGSAWFCPYPMGELARVTRTVNTPSFGAIQYFDSVTATIEASRKIRVRFVGNTQANTAGIGLSVGICNSGGTILNQSYNFFNTAGVAEVHTVEHHMSAPAAGSTQFKIGAYTSAGTGIIVGGATATASIIVDDLGPI